MLTTRILLGIAVARKRSLWRDRNLDPGSLGMVGVVLMLAVH
jgi:hypothetical protein